MTIASGSQLLLRRCAAVAIVGLFSDSNVLGQQTRPTPAPAQTQPTPAPRADLPAAKDIIDASIEAMGGRDAFDALDSVAIAAVLDASGPMNLKANKDGGLLYVQGGPKGETAVGFDGENGWHRSPTYALLPPEQLAKTRNELALFTYQLIAEPSDYFETMETVDRVTLEEGSESYKLRMRFKEQPESEHFWYFNVDDKLLNKVEQMRETNLGTFISTRRLSEWKPLGAFKLFTKVTIENPGAPAGTIVYNDVQFNNVDPAVFELPAEVKELLKQVGEQPATAPSTQPATQPTAPSKPADN